MNDKQFGKGGGDCDSDLHSDGSMVHKMVVSY